MNTRRQPDRIRAGSWRRCLRPLLGALLPLLLGGGSAAPAGANLTVDASNSSAAMPYIISGSVSGTITVNSGGVLNVVDGAQISGGDFGVDDEGGMVTISGGSISGGLYGVDDEGGTVTISGGSISVVYVQGGTVSISGSTTISGQEGVSVHGGTVSISGGSITGSAYGVTVGDGTLTILGGTISGSSSGVSVGGGTANISGGTISGSIGVYVPGGAVSISGGSISGPYGVFVQGGTVTMSGCNLRLVGNQLIGALGDGSLIDTNTAGVTSQNLVNQDTGPLQLTCPLNVTAPAASGACSASLNPGTAAASDGCSAPPVVVGVRSDGAALTDPYPVGTTTITWTATDAAHGSTSCDQTITVSAASGQHLTISAPPPVTVNTDPGMCSARNVSLGTATASGNCSSVTVTNNAPATFPKGTTTVIWTATDAAGNTATATQTVTVNDTQKPTITCPGNITVPATSAGGAVVNYPAPTASDNCGTPTVLSSPPSGSIFPVGMTPVTCTATDAAGNQSTCGFTITVTPKADLSLAMSASPSPVVSGTNLTYTLVATNNGPQAAQGVALTDPVPAGSSFVSATRSPAVGTLTTPKGTSSTVSWSAGTLNSGQSVTLTVVVKVSAKAGATLTNTASVSSTSPLDPNLANNKATVMTSVVAKR